MKTAVEWLASNLGEHIVWEEKLIDLVEQAKEMEKQKTIDFAYDIADDLACGVLSKKAIEDRYNETFKSE